MEDLCLIKLNVTYCYYIKHVEQIFIDFEWAICCLTPNERFFNYITARTRYIRWNDNDVRFVLDQLALLHLHSEFSLTKQESLWVDMSLHSEALSWFRANKSLLFLLNCCVLTGEATNTNCIVFDLTDWGSNSLSSEWVIVA